jgi:uracil-DNA glycosylase
MKLVDIIHDSWTELFAEIKMLPEWIKINKLNPDNFYPLSKDVFNVFRMPVNQIRVVILGQDPYPQEGQAIGYAFAVSHDTKKPFSLKVIEKEIGHPIDKTLQDWVNQGVFLLNTALTVEKKNAGSHTSLWKPITTKIISYIATNNPCIWMLWGKYAQTFIPIIEKEGNTILTAPHPAAEAYGNIVKFTGCRHFIKVNELLKENNKLLINW